jgi:hypothetical protein
LKIVLIFSPFVVPSYIPLGIAQIKSYIEKHLPSVKVFNLDLNNQFFDNLTKKNFLEKFINLCAICPRKYKKNKNEKDNLLNQGKIFKIAVDCLKDKKAGIFYDISKYNYFISKINSFLYNRTNCINSIARETIQKGLPIASSFENLFEDDLKMISRISPDFVGFSVFCTEQLLYSAILAKIIKKKLNLPIIFGGAFMSHLDIQEFLGFFDFIDFVISGEGEIGIVEFAKNFPKKTFDNVPGLYYRQMGKILFNNKKFIENLDCLPFPDFSDFILERYLLPFPVLPVIFSRGCFWKKCAFCTYYKHYPISYKTKSIKKFITEIRYYNSKGFRHFFIDDDVISALDLNAISTALNKNKIKIFFGAIVRPEKGFSCRVLANIYSAGGRVLIWGVESSCQRILDLMKKGSRIKYIKSILKSSSESGFHNHLFMIEGFPTQTEEEIYKDIKFLQEKRDFIHSFCIHRFSLKQDSRIFYNLKKFKINSIKALPLYTCIKNKTTLHSGKFAFEGGIKLNWERIESKETKVFKRFKNASIQGYDDIEHSHMLLHASRNQSVKAD